MAFDDDDAPLALLKKQKCGYKDSSSTLSDNEVAISLTNLQHATPIRGPIYNFLNTPLLRTPGTPNEMRPRFPSAAQGFPDHQNLHLPQQLLSVTNLKTGQPNPSPMDVQIATPAYVAASHSAKPAAATKVSPSRHFILANRGRRTSSTTAARTTAVTTVPVSDQEERPVRPPPTL